MITHVEKMRVNWVDTDASGIIHYTAALRYFEVAEHALLRKLFDGRGGPNDRGFFMPRVHVEADYKAPLRYPEPFECEARVEAIGRSSLTFAYQARRSDGVVCLVGRIVAVAVDADGKSIPFPDAFRETLKRAL